MLTDSSICCLKLYEVALLKRDKVKIVYENKKDFVRKVAIKASNLDVGARGLKTVVDETFLNAISEVGEESPQDRELFISSNIVDDPNAYVLRKVQRNGYGVLERVRERTY